MDGQDYTDRQDIDEAILKTLLLYDQGECLHFARF